MYDLTFTSRKFMPNTVTGDREQIAADIECLVMQKSRRIRAVYCDIFTDQIDVIIIRMNNKRERIATYMA